MNKREIFMEWQLFKSKIDGIAAAVQNDVELSNEEVMDLKLQISNAEEDLYMLGKETVNAVSVPTASEEE